MADTSRQINPRISVPIFDKLEIEAQRKGLTITSLTGNILEDYVNKRTLKEERGDVTIGKQVLRYIIEDNNSEQDEMESNIEKASNEILAEWKLQTSNLTFNEFDKRICEWHNLNKLRIRSFYDNKHVRYVIKHDLGYHWSEFQCKMYCKILEKLDKMIVSSSFDDLSFTIEVSHQKIENSNQ